MGYPTVREKSLPAEFLASSGVEQALKGGSPSRFGMTENLLQRRV